MKKIIRKLLVLITVGVMFTIPVSNVYADQGFAGKWVLDKEEESYINITERTDGSLSVEFFLYRIYSMDGSGYVSADGKRAIFDTPAHDIMGVMDLDGDSLVFRIVLPPNSAADGMVYDLTETYVYHKE